MKHIFTSISKCTIVIFLLMACFGTGQAQAPNPPHQPPIPTQQPGRPTAAQSNAPQTNALTLGQPGLSFRYIKTFGVTEVPYFADTIHLNRPHGLYMDGSNNLFVIEAEGRRVLKFDSSGTNLLSIGKAGVGYTDDYVFNYPMDVDLDPAGNIWVADGSRVAQFSPTGTFLQNVPSTDPWQNGNDNTRFNGAQGIAIDRASNLMFVSDNWNHRVQIYDVSGVVPVYSATIGVNGVSGNDNAHFNQPGRLALDSNHNLYVVDFGNNRVQRCSFNVGTWTCGYFFGTLDQPSGITVDSSNNVFIADYMNDRIVKCTSAAVCTTFEGGSRPADVAVDSSGNVFGAEVYNAFVFKFDGSGNYLGTFAGIPYTPYLTDANHYNHPRVAIDKDDNLIILEENGQRLLKLNSLGIVQWSIGTPGFDVGDNDHLNWPHGVATDKFGSIYVADNNRVQIFNGNGVYQVTIGGSWGNGNYQFQWASGIAVDRNNGNIYVSDAPNQRVQVYNSNRVYLATIGQNGVSGSDNNHFDGPLGIEVDTSGNIYVADNNNCRVQKFNSSRVYQMTFGTTGSCTNSFADVNAEDVTVDSLGRVYVAGWDNRVEVYDTNGAYLTTIGGSWGNRTGEFRGASGVALDSMGSVYVSDFGNARIQKFTAGVPGWIQKNINGFGDPNNDTIALIAHNGMLYAGTQNNTSGGQIWRTADGRNWSAIQLYGGAYSGGENTSISPIEEFNSYLYVGTQNQTTGGQIWRCALCDGSDWQNVLNGGELGPSYINVQTVIGHAGALYATVTSWDGLAVLRSTNGDTGTWKQVNTSGFGKSSNAYTWTAVDYHGYYYVATNTPDSWNFGPVTTTGVEVWRCATCAGSDWQQVNVSGFGDGRNGAYSMVEFNNTLYLSVINLLTGVQIRRCTVCDGSDWEQVNTNGFGQSNRYGATLVPYEGKLLAFTSDLWTSPDRGVELFITKDGTHWDPVMIHGWGDSNNWVVNGNQVFAGSLYVGVFNSAYGGEIWQYLNKQVFLPSITR